VTTAGHQSTPLPITERGSTTTVAVAATPPPSTPRPSTPPPSGAPAGTAGPAPVTAGTWHFTQLGTTTVGALRSSLPPAGTLVVAPADPTGMQISHRYTDPAQAPTDTTTSFAHGGMFLLSEVLRMRVGSTTESFTCAFNPGVPVPPWPPRVGSHFGGDGNCGAFGAHIDGQIAASRSATVGGTSVPVFVAVSTLTTQGQIAATFSETDWFAPSIRLSVHVETSGHGTYGFVSFTSISTSDLQSLSPT
jgi:hypothetical protein